MAVMCAVVEHGTDSHSDLLLLPMSSHCPQLTSPEAVMARLDSFKAPPTIIVKHRTMSSKASPIQVASVETHMSPIKTKKKGMIKSFNGSPRSTTAHTETKPLSITSKRQSRRIQSILRREEDIESVLFCVPVDNVFLDKEEDADSLYETHLSSSFHLLLDIDD